MARKTKKAKVKTKKVKAKVKRRKAKVGTKKVKAKRKKTKVKKVKVKKAKAERKKTKVKKVKVKVKVKKAKRKKTAVRTKRVKAKAKRAKKIKKAARAAVLSERAKEHRARRMPKVELPDLTKLESLVSTVTHDAAERLVTEATKFDIGVAHNGMAMPAEAALPDEYGKDRVVLLVVDPSFVFTYWEVTNDSLRRSLEQAGHAGKLTLRFYDISQTGTTHGSRFWDVEVFDRLGNWYLRLANPEQRLCLDIGVKNAAGEFFTISRSNIMKLPPQGLAKPGPIKWMVVTPSGEKLVSDVEEYTDADLDLLKRILGPYFFDLLMRGRLASITGSSVEAVFYDVESLGAGHSPAGSTWSEAR